MALDFFYINIPIGIIGIALASKFLGGTGIRKKHPLDWVGFALTSCCFAGLIFGLSVIGSPALPPAFGACVALAGFICGVFYVLRAKRVAVPLLDLNVFREPVFRTVMVAGFIFRLAIGGMPFLFPLMLQVGFGYTPFEAGSILFSGAVGAILMKFALKPALARFGFRTLMIFGVCVVVLLISIQGTYNSQTPTWFMMAILLCSGFFSARCISRP